ncbi:MAG: ATP-binding protein [Rhodomicrobium sp.]
MDQETLNALIEVYRTRGDTDLLLIIMDEAEGQRGRESVLELLRSLSADVLTNDKFAPVRRQACQFSLSAGDFELAERLARGSELPEDRALRARALHGLGRDQEAIALYRQAVAQDPAMRNRELERFLGIRQAANVLLPAAKVIPLTSYSSRRENRAEPSREAATETFIEDFDEGTVTFNEVAGLDHVKTEIQRRMVLPYVKKSLYESYRQKAGGNLLLYGPPGCGKTMIARAAAGTCDARFLSVNPEEVLDKYAGEAEKRLRVFFDEARSEPPAILFFDDFEVLSGPRKAAQGEAGRALVSAIISELDGTQRNNAGLLVLAATNAPWLLDPALFRAGRFHRLLCIPPPVFEARKKILTNAITGVPGHGKIAFDRIARKADGFSGADIRALSDWVCNAALTRALSRSAETLVTTAMFEEGLNAFGPSTREWFKVARAEMRSLQRNQSLPRAFSDLYRN